MALELEKHVVQEGEARVHLPPVGPSRPRRSHTQVSAVALSTVASRIGHPEGRPKEGVHLLPPAHGHPEAPRKPRIAVLPTHQDALGKEVAEGLFGIGVRTRRKLVRLG